MKKTRALPNYVFDFRSTFYIAKTLEASKKLLNCWNLQIEMLLFYWYIKFSYIWLLFGDLSSAAKYPNTYKFELCTFGIVRSTVNPKKYSIFYLYYYCGALSWTVHNRAIEIAFHYYLLNILFHSYITHYKKRIEKYLKHKSLSYIYCSTYVYYYQIQLIHKYSSSQSTKAYQSSVTLKYYTSSTWQLLFLSYLAQKNNLLIMQHYNIILSSIIVLKRSILSLSIACKPYLEKIQQLFNYSHTNDVGFKAETYLWALCDHQMLHNSDASNLIYIMYYI